MNQQMFNIPVMMRKFFGEYLPLHRSCSPHTISAYAKSFSLFLKYLSERKKIRPPQIKIDDFSSENILGFLNYLEQERGNTISTRNARLAAIHSFAKYLLMERPEWIAYMQEVLAVPIKKKETKTLGYLTHKEIEAIIVTLNDKNWYGYRDKVLFSLMYNTGARVSEIVDLHVRNLKLDKNGTVSLTGKGRKDRVLPLWKSTIDLLRQWIEKNRYTADSPLFPNSRGKKMTRSAVTKRLTLAVSMAKKTCPTLKKRTISPHTVRHTSAMHLLQSGVDITVISLWLGHESIETTHMYLSADMEMKEKALEAMEEPAFGSFRYKADDDILQYLDNL
jgi:site-specific recombinase XerD